MPVSNTWQRFSGKTSSHCIASTMMGHTLMGLSRASPRAQSLVVYSSFIIIYTHIYIYTCTRNGTQMNSNMCALEMAVSDQLGVSKLRLAACTGNTSNEFQQVTQQFLSGTEILRSNKKKIRSLLCLVAVDERYRGSSMCIVATKYFVHTGVVAVVQQYSSLLRDCREFMLLRYASTHGTGQQ